jgi:hypothetical protein
MNRSVERFLREAQAIARYEPREDHSDAFNAIDKLSIAAYEALRRENQRVFVGAIDALKTIYDSVPSLSEYSIDYSHPAERDRARYWLEIIERVFLIGAAAVRDRQWWAVRDLSLRHQDIGPSFPGYSSWLRHATVMASRAELLVAEDQNPCGGLVLSMARELGVKLSPLRADLPEPDSRDIGEAPLNSDPLLNSLCQFDFAWCVVVEASSDGRDTSPYFPSCAALFQERTQPIIRMIAKSSSLRTALLPNVPERAVAAAMRNVIDMAVTQARYFGGFWIGVEADPDVQRFVQGGGAALNG